jgi:hypothetical protein
MFAISVTVAVFEVVKMITVVGYDYCYIFGHNNIHIYLFHWSHEAVVMFGLLLVVSS